MHSSVCVPLDCLVSPLLHLAEFVVKKAPIVLYFGVEPVWNINFHYVFYNLFQVVKVISLQSMFGAPNSEKPVGCC